MTILDKAKQVTTGDRQRDYDHPLWNFIRIALLWNSHLMSTGKLNKLITPEDVAWMMVNVKQARQIKTSKEDNLVDGAGYLACIEQMNILMHELGYIDGIKSFEGKNIAVYQNFMEKHYGD